MISDRPASECTANRTPTPRAARNVVKGESSLGGVAGRTNTIATSRGPGLISAERESAHFSEKYGPIGNPTDRCAVIRTVPNLLWLRESGHARQKSHQIGGGTVGSAVPWWSGTAAAPGNPGGG